MASDEYPDEYPDDHSPFCSRRCGHPCHDAYDRATSSAEVSDDGE